MGIMCVFFYTRGVVNDGDMSVLSNKVSSMQAKLNNLRETEENLDRLCKAMRENYKQARKSPSNEFFSYVTRDDLLEVFGEDTVILTVRNCDTVRQGTAKEEDNTEKHTLRVNGRWKKVDVRLVTTDGEVASKSARTDETETDGELSDAQKPTTSSQTENKTNVIGSRRPGRRRKPERFELKEDDNSVEIDQPKNKKILTEDEKEHEERRVTAETLLGYRPPSKQRKRNMDEDWLESRYLFCFSNL